MIQTAHEKHSSLNCHESIHMYSFFLLINTSLFCYFPFFRRNSFSAVMRLRALSLTLGHHGLVTKIQHPPCHSSTSVSGLGTKFLLQAAAGRGHLRSRIAAGDTRSEDEAVAAEPQKTLERPSKDASKAETLQSADKSLMD